MHAAFKWIFCLSWAALSGLLTPAIAPAEERPDGDPSITAQERSAVIEGIIERLKETYVNLETAHAVERALRARQADQAYEKISSGKELAGMLNADLREITRDRHLSVTFFPLGARELSPDNASEADQKAHREFLEKINFGFEKAERMRGNIGYLELHGFAPAELGAATATAAMSFIAHSDALIIDLRKNRGGEPGMIAYVLSYLFDKPTHLNDMYQRQGDKTQQWWTLPHVPGQRFGEDKPVFVLTSRDTFSGGEEFAYDLQALKRALIIGETTKGGAHDSKPVKLTEHFMIELPFARAINPITGKNWEGTGVVPDVATPANEALDVAYRRAIQRVAATTTNPRQKAQLEELLEKRTE